MWPVWLLSFFWYLFIFGEKILSIFFNFLVVAKMDGKIPSQHHFTYPGTTLETEFVFSLAAWDACVAMILAMKAKNRLISCVTNQLLQKA